MQGETNSESTGRFNEVFDLLSTVRPELPNQIYVEVKVEKGDQRVAAQAYECLFAHLLWLGRISSKLEPAQFLTNTQMKQIAPWKKNTEGWDGWMVANVHKDFRSTEPGEHEPASEAAVIANEVLRTPQSWTKTEPRLQWEECGDLKIVMSPIFPWVATLVKDLEHAPKEVAERLPDIVQRMENRAAASWRQVCLDLNEPNVQVPVTSALQHMLHAVWADGTFRKWGNGFIGFALTASPFWYTRLLIVGRSHAPVIDFAARVRQVLESGIVQAYQGG